VENNEMTNEQRATAVEQYILEQAVQAGVVKKIKITTPRNPNKWGKTLVPWFNDNCRETKKERARIQRLHGKGDTRSIEATKAYLKACKLARLEFA
jgi:hypothetical protein